LLGAFAGPATAANLVVSTLEDPTDSEFCNVSELECSLRHAIEFANEDGGSSTITFAVEGTIELDEDPLPGNAFPLTVDATTLEGYEGAPLVEIDGSEVEVTEGAVSAGFNAENELTVEGVAIGNFRYGVLVSEFGFADICGSYIGVGLNGADGSPNQYGVVVEAGSGEGEIPGTSLGGDACPAGGNLISGNEIAGVLDEGEGTFLSENAIGVDAFGDPLPNGIVGPPPNGGVVVAPGADEATVGSNNVGAGNTIAYNVGAGVRNLSISTLAWVKNNSIFDNDGPGIAIEGNKPSPPTITGFSEAGGLAAIKGTVQASGQEEGEVEFFASRACDPSGAGEGEVPLGQRGFETDGSGAGTFVAEGLLPPPPGTTVLTATVTGDTVENTTEFSACFPLAKPPIVPPAIVDTLIPVNGKVVVVEPVAGTILVKRPGQKKFTPLKEGEEIPIGSIVDATKGKVVLTTTNAAGEEQSATFYGGAFLVQQAKGSEQVVLTLKRGNFKSCKKGGGASASKRKGRKLWGSGKGSFKTKGNHGSATVRGTVWLTEDRCGATFFKVKEGVVTVRDFDDRRTLKLKAGKSYLAKP
jgi:hypothetical protein